MLRSRTQVIPFSAALVFGVFAAICIFAGSARAELPQEQGSLYLQTQANVRITFASDLNLRQPEVAGAGDVNGDGIDDLIVGAFPPSGGHYVPNFSSGAAFVIFGKESLTTVDPGQLGENGFRINHATPRSIFASVSGAGDVNGDGLADVIIGMPGEDDDARPSSGAAFVVYGKNSNDTVNLDNLEDGGFRIRGAQIAGSTGNSVAGAGDINGDDLADLIVGSHGASDNGLLSGSASVVFGKADDPATPDVREDTGPVDLSALGEGGFRIFGAEAYDYAGVSVSGADDINGDGTPDVIVGAPGAECANGEHA